MANLDMTKALNISTTAVPGFTVEGKQLDEPTDKKTEWNNDNWDKYFSYYKTIPEVHQAINALANYVIGKGYDTESTRDQVRLEGITGSGEDSFKRILMNLFITKKINGDSFAEIIRNDRGTLVNLKPLNPKRTKVIYNKQGLIEEYKYMQVDGKFQTFQPHEIFHIMNNRQANEIHGTSSIESCQETIDWFMEAQRNLRRIMFMSSIRILYVDMQNDSQLQKIRSTYTTALKRGTAMILPGKKGQDFEIVDYSTPPITEFLNGIRFLEDKIYRNIGTPRVILGGAADFTEAGAKIGYLTFEVPIAAEQQELENDIWNQLAMKLTFRRPPSLKDNIQEDEQKNAGQVGIQPNETQASLTRTE